MRNLSKGVSHYLLWPLKTLRDVVPLNNSLNVEKESALKFQPLPVGGARDGSVHAVNLNTSLGTRRQAGRLPAPWEPRLQEEQAEPSLQVE